MQEQKRVFLKGKMNKDLDDRIVPNGEYRDAQNVVIATSEGSDVGTVQTILGNTAQIEGITGDPIYAIPDHNKDTMYVWTTDGLFQVYRNPRSITANFPFLSLQLLSGSFLNFSANSVFQANILENYLYWVDGVNQPRVIDIDRAVSSAEANEPYYTNEDHISVAKYNPYKVMRSIRRIETNYIAAGSSGTTVVLDYRADIAVGDYLLNWTTYEFIGIVETVTQADPITTVVIDRTPPTLTNSDEVYIYQSTQTDKSDPSTYPEWPGDPDFLEDKFVRFSYRYKYDDDTYSLIAPYTQPIYKPKQGGYFATGDEEKAYKSTIVKFMENAINNVEFFVPLPTDQPAVDYKIKEVEIIFTESDKVSAQIVETIPVERITVESDYALDGAYFKYEYRSTIPYKTVTQQDYIRVSDQIPILARAQAIASNRVMYGNFDTRLDAPESINFSVGADEKSGKEEIHAEYQNHTVKQNRNYQIGIVLKDKYGRSSGVISSDFLNEVTTAVSQSTEYHAYKDNLWNPGVKNWLGDSLKVNMHDKIPATNLYAEESGFFTITANPTFSSDGTQIEISGDHSSTINFGADSYLRGKYKDYVKVTSVGVGFNPSPVTTIVCDGEISTEVYSFKPYLESTQTMRVYSINNLGWYTYTVVAKQLEQDYYNVYLPDLINGTLFFDHGNPGAGNHWSNTDADQAVTLSLFSDNINKVPRDLTEVGPDQEQYRSSSVTLSGRVTNTASGNAQYYPGRVTHEIGRIGTLKELFANVEDDSYYSDTIDELSGSIQNKGSNPLIGVGEISDTANAIGTSLANILLKTGNLDLAVYETEPVKSRLEIYYETSTTGLISDINNLVENSSTGPVRITDVTATLDEDEDYSGPSPTISNFFQVENVQGADITPDEYGIESVVNAEGTVVSNDLFELSLSGNDFSLQATSVAAFEYTRQSSLLHTYTVNMYFTTLGLTPDKNVTLKASAIVNPGNAGVEQTLWVPNDTALGGPYAINTDPSLAGDGNFIDNVNSRSSTVFTTRLHNGSNIYAGTSQMPGTDVVVNISNITTDGTIDSLTFPQVSELGWADTISKSTNNVTNGYGVARTFSQGSTEGLPKEFDVRYIIKAKILNADTIDNPYSATFNFYRYNTTQVIDSPETVNLTPSTIDIEQEAQSILWLQNGHSRETENGQIEVEWSFDPADHGKELQIEYTVAKYSTHGAGQIGEDDYEYQWNSNPDANTTDVFTGVMTAGDPATHQASPNVAGYSVSYDTTNSDYIQARVSVNQDKSPLVKDFTYSFDWEVADVNGETGSENYTGTYTFLVTEDTSIPPGEKPVITLLGDSSVSIELGTQYTDAGATAVAYNGLVITRDIVVDNLPDIYTIGTYVITYNVTDKDGKAADEVTRTVEVTGDVTAPTDLRFKITPDENFVFASYDIQADDNDRIATFTLEVRGGVIEDGSTVFDPLTPWQTIMDAVTPDSGFNGGTWFKHLDNDDNQPRIPNAHTLQYRMTAVDPSANQTVKDDIYIYKGGTQFS